MDLTEADLAMVKDITRMGVRAAVLLKGVMLKKVDRETLEWGLQELAIRALMDKYFQRLIDRPEYVDLLNIMHLTYSLEGQLDFQIREYGMDSLKDDLQEINFSLQQIGSKFNFAEIRAAV
jgi:hypothetical protein